MTHSLLSFGTTSWLLTMNCRSTLLIVVSTSSGQSWQRRIRTFYGAMRFPHLAHLVTTLSVIAHSNADSERMFSMCLKIDTDPRSQLCNQRTTICTLFLQCKINIDEPCYAFQVDSDLLKSSKSATWNYVKLGPPVIVTSACVTLWLFARSVL